MQSLLIGRTLVASLFLGILGIGGALFVSLESVDIRIEPSEGTYVAGETFTVQVVVESEKPVNVFKGNILFDTSVVSIEKIDYNTSIANLWAEEPWYSNGDGTLNFIGGTTQSGGFVGVGSLITITFKAVKAGTATIAMNDVRILQHDGFGTAAEVAEPIDAIFTVHQATIENKTVLAKTSLGTNVQILPEQPNTDLNNDGVQSIADVSIFMGHLVTQNSRSDFNKDGSVSTADLSVLLNAD